MPSRIIQNVPVGGNPTAAVPPQSDRVALAPRAQQQQQQAVVVPAAAPTLKLSFGGVDFSLVPKTSRDGTVTFQAMGANEAVLSLQNFTGSLRVTCTTAAGGVASPYNSSLVEDSGSPSPERPMAAALANKPPRTSPTQQQLTSWTQRKTSTPTTTTKTTTTASSSSQAPTPTTTNGSSSNKKRSNASSTIEQVVQANRSSPLPYHSPVKRSRQQDTKKAKSKKTKTTKQITPLADQLPPSPISLAQKSPASSIGDHTNHDSIDCSQTQPSQPSSSSFPSNEEDPVTETTRLQQDEEDPSVATRNPDDDDDDDDMIVDDGGDDDDDDDDKEMKENQAPKKTKSQQKEGASTTEALSSDVSTKSDEKNACVTPAPRWGHTMTMVDHNRLLMYGGQSFQASSPGGDVIPTTMADVHVFEIDKQTWFQPISCDDKARQWPRQWHSATFLPQRQLLICFGGETMNPKTGRVTTSDKNNLMVLDTEILLWYPPSVSGDLPSGRSGHSSTLLPSSSNNELVIFGGVKSGKHLNSVSVLDTTRWIWSTPKIQGVAPKARSYHSATAIQATHCGNTSTGGVDASGGHHSDLVSNSKTATINIRQRIVIFGGNDTKQSFATVHVLEKIEGANTTWRWFHPTVNGSPPTARTGHSATLLADQKTICVYGGWDPSEDDGSKNAKQEDNLNDDDEKIFSDSFLLDTDTWTWKKGSTPVFSGHSLDASQGTDGGARRVGHAAVLNTTINNSNGKGAANNEVLVFGGRVPGDTFTGDFQALTMS